MCSLINNCSDCMADCLGLDTRRYDLGGLEGRNQEISNANWHWRFLASPQGLIKYIISVRNTLSLLANKRVSGLTDPPGDVNYNSAGWTAISSIDEFNQYMSYPLPEVVRTLCAAISPQSLDNIILCPYQFGGGAKSCRDSDAIRIVSHIPNRLFVMPSQYREDWRQDGGTQKDY